MVTNNLTLTAETNAMSGQPAPTTQGGETSETSFSELLQSASKSVLTEQYGKGDAARAFDSADAEIINGELVKGLDGILKDMLNIVKENEGKDAQGEMLQLLMKMMSGKSDDEENKKANELVMSVLANLVNNGADLTSDVQLPVTEQTVIGTVDFTVTPIVINATETPLQQTSDGQALQTGEYSGKNQPSAPEMQQTAGKMLDSLLSYAKENLGATSAAFTATQSAQPQTAEQLKQSFGFTYAKAADTVDSAKTNELEQLISNLGDSRTESANPTADNQQQPAAITNRPVQPAQQPQQVQQETQTDSSSQQSDQKRPTENAAAGASEIFTSETHTEQLPEQAKSVDRPVQVQVAEAIADRLSRNGADDTEFTLELNPGNLGKITLKLTADSEGKIAVEITASNPDTQKLLDARAENVQQSLRQNGVELEKYQVVYSADEAAFNGQSYDGSSKNPYLRQEENDSEENSSDVDFAEILSSM